MNLCDFDVRFGYGKPSGANFAHIPVEVGTAGGNNNHKRGRYAGHQL